jgi:hypothetical protein
LARLLPFTIVVQVLVNCDLIDCNRRPHRNDWLSGSSVRFHTLLISASRLLASFMYSQLLTLPNTGNANTVLLWGGNETFFYF